MKKQLSTLFITFLSWLMPPLLHAKPLEPSLWQTKNGAQVIFYQTLEVPMLDLSIAFAAGSAHDGKAFGLSALTTQLLNQGSRGVNANLMAEQLAATGAQFEAQSNKDMVSFNLKTLTAPENLSKATELFSTIVSGPDFPIESFDREKKQQLMAIAQAHQSPEEMANQTFFKILYQQHPYAHPSIGLHETVSALTIEQVRGFYQQFFNANNAIIVLVGAIDEPRARQLAESFTKNLPKGYAAKAIPPAESLKTEINVEVPFPSSQTILRLGQMGIEPHNPHYFPLQVGNYILGGSSMLSRLTYELREKRGLTYGISSQLLPMPGKGLFLISFSTRHRQAKTAKDLTRDILASFIKNGPNEAELVAAKQYLTGNFPLSMGSNRSIANLLLKIAFYHLPKDYLQTYIDHINAVSAEEIKKAFQELITPNKLLEVSVGKP